MHPFVAALQSVTDSCIWRSCTALGCVLYALFCSFCMVPRTEDMFLTPSAISPFRSCSGAPHLFSCWHKDTYCPLTSRWGPLTHVVTEMRVGWSERTASKHVYYQVWNRLPVQVGCMRQVLGAGALGWPRGMRWGGRWEGGSGWGTYVNPWLIHVNVWQKPLQYCKVISLQLIKINGKKKESIVPQSAASFQVTVCVPLRTSAIML